MGSNFDLTDKTQETLGAAIQLAKDYSNAHGMHFRLRHSRKKLLTDSSCNSCAGSHRVCSLERRRW